MGIITKRVERLLDVYRTKARAGLVERGAMLALVAGLAAERGARCKSFVEGGVAEDDVEFQSELVQVLCDVTDLALSVYVSLADRGRSQLPTAAVDRTVARGTSVARDDRES